MAVRTVLLYALAKSPMRKSGYAAEPVTLQRASGITLRIFPFELSVMT